MKIDTAGPADIPAILGLWMELMDYHAALDPVFERSADGPTQFAGFLRDLIRSKEAIVLVVREGEGGRPGGYAMARITRDPPIFARMPRGEIIDFYLRPEARRRGAGSALLERIKSWFAERGIGRLEVRVYAGNPVGASFWRKHGFGDYLETLYLEIDGLRKGE